MDTQKIIVCDVDTSNKDIEQFIKDNSDSISPRNRNNTVSPDFVDEVDIIDTPVTTNQKSIPSMLNSIGESLGYKNPQSKLEEIINDDNL